jgi:hypothetical protein
MLKQKRTLLIVVMMGVALIIGASAIYVIYQPCSFSRDDG